MPESPVRIKSDLELTREANIKRRDDFFASLIKNDPDFADVMNILTNTDKPANKKIRVRNNTRQDPTFRCRSSLPLERRRSARLQNVPPEEDSATNKRKRSDGDYDDLEEVIYPTRESKVNNRPSAKRYTHHIIPPEKVDDSMIISIAKRADKKVYSCTTGTCCHQCRQKTVDQKTCCRNVNCIGVRGQFCGICLYNRYGEIASEALKDPNWHCPVCRGICNCSFCRAKAGKRPTGILAPMAQQAGHKSVKDFLDSLRGQGDFPDQDELPRENPEPYDYTNQDMLPNDDAEDELPRETSEPSDCTEQNMLPCENPEPNGDAEDDKLSSENPEPNDNANQGASRDTSTLDRNLTDQDILSSDNNPEPNDDTEQNELSHESPEANNYTDGDKLSRNSPELIDCIAQDELPPSSPAPNDIATKAKLPPPEPKELLGFSSDGCIAYMIDGEHKFCQEEKTRFDEKCDKYENLLGFYNDSNIGLLENNVQYELMPLFPVDNLEDTDQDKENLCLAEEDIKMEMNSELLQETQATAASG